MIQFEGLQLRSGEAAPGALDWTVADGGVTFLLCRSRPWLYGLYQTLRGFVTAPAGRVLLDGQLVRAGEPVTAALFAEGPERGHESADWVLADFLTLQARLLGTPDERLWPQLVRCGVDPARLRRRADEAGPATRAMLFLAMALAAGGRNWVLFDMVRGLGADAELRLRELLQEQRRPGAGAVLYLSDDVFWAAQAADRVGIVRGGRLVLDLQAPALREMDLSRIHLDFLR